MKRHPTPIGAQRSLPSTFEIRFHDPVRDNQKRKISVPPETAI
jgi:hypothetical protein